MPARLVTRITLFVAVAMLAAACFGGASAGNGSPPTRAQAPTQAPAEPQAGSLAAAACNLPHIWLLRQWRGYDPGRSPDLIMLPYPPNYIGSGYPHVGPWDYLERVPLLLYGPGYVKPVGVIKRDVTAADWAPTQAELLHFSHTFPDGHPLTDALVPATQRVVPPKLIVTVVWDAGGRDVLSAWPNSWPHIKSLIPKGAWYDNANMGSAPTSTAQGHATIGTGAFPNKNGIIGNHVRINGHITGPWRKGPNLLKLPTLADLYDVAMGNRSKVGFIGNSPWHLGMLGHGSYWQGGDKDAAVIHAEGGPQWSMPLVFRTNFRYADYVNDNPALSTYFPFADASDGRVDGTWRGHTIEDEELGFGTTARIPYQTRAIETMIRHENMGKDDVPDLFYTNYKLIDHLSHIYTMNSLEMKDAVEVDDAYIPVLINFLNDWVGRGKWVMMLTADHGAMPDPQVTRAYRGSTSALKGYLNRVFDHDDDNVSVIMNLQPTHIFLNVKELQQNGFTVGQVAEYISRLTESQLAASDSIIKPGDENKRVFQAVFPSNLMQSLPCLPEAREG